MNMESSAGKLTGHGLTCYSYISSRADFSLYDHIVIDFFPLTQPSCPVGMRVELESLFLRV
jgi:hypothetical protein